MDDTVFLRSLSLRNFLSYGPGGAEIELRPLNVLIGANGSGKSNFIEALGLLRALPHDFLEPVRKGGGIAEFCNALTDHPDAVNFLLVDAEDQVTDFGKVWDHLKTRDGWESPGVGDDRAHLMVCTMEAWFVADHETLARYFHKDVDKVPDYANVEGVSKETVEALMRKVSTGPGHHVYEKIRDGIRLLSRTRPAIVQAKALHCRRLFETLDAIISAL